MHCHAPGSAGCMCSRSFDDSNCLVLSQQQSSPRHISDLACKKIYKKESQQKDWIITQVLGQYHVLPWWTLCNPGLCFKMCLCSEQLQECCPNWSYRTRAVCTCKSQPLIVRHWTNQGISADRYSHFCSCSVHCCKACICSCILSLHLSLIRLPWSSNTSCSTKRLIWMLGLFRKWMSSQTAACRRCSWAVAVPELPPEPAHQPDACDANESIRCGPAGLAHVLPSVYRS